MRANKYKVAPMADRTVDGIVFASKAESQRYQELRALKRNGDCGFTLQPRYQPGERG